MPERGKATLPINSATLARARRDAGQQLPTGKLLFDVWVKHLFDLNHENLNPLLSSVGTAAAAAAASRCSSSSDCSSSRCGRAEGGGLTKIKHVGSNKEVQELGRFSVGEYNDRLRGRDANPLAFVKVVEAQQQVVEGMQYYLKIAVAAPDGSHKIYNAVVWTGPGSNLARSFLLKRV
uniref:Cystatin domain-containing protein n=1 Tax=Ananas comosus var. bracteatus TaxID=296719 RepID=A0A6V7PHH5_ANACO|nr:unnamed protein product [Ananas comosus var. bracteatus]